MANYSTAQILAMEPRGRRSPRDVPGRWEPWPGRVRGFGGGCVWLSGCALRGEHGELPSVGAGSRSSSMSCEQRSCGRGFGNADSRIGEVLTGDMARIFRAASSSSELCPEPF